ncbi:HalOD1 output domain-containing protein [Saliphagus infecundisoli]|uniref:HalOD1 output domain-containing protein n=1 Tax=Saliphagus infecundisoli TaxID=1849069 RepID=A0ABD5QJZ1_9EURY|nr:HalOD1 output domain-containing protein [Saliphagus infecundisoli]
MTDRPPNGSDTALPDQEVRQVAQRHYAPDEDTELTTTIVETIADAQGTHPTDLKSPPLYEVIDASALEETFFGPDISEHPRQGSGSVSFYYGPLIVTVKSDGWVHVYEPLEDDR